ncbi:MAG: L,D-transpeptidase [Anaerolineaceae bacterium]|nr:L,D-transpeptidase [Anaerolineaceae bacterium]
MANKLDIHSLSRREFLWLGGVSLVSLLALNKSTLALAESLAQSSGEVGLGRITTNKVDMYDTPSLEGKLIRTLWKDLVMPINKVEIGRGEPAHNKVWYLMNNEGYVHSGSVQPVEIRKNDPAVAIPEKGVLAEVTVPFTDAVWNPIFKKLVAYRLYYSTTHWILDVLQDDKGETWYEVLEDFYQFRYYVQSSHLRIIPPEETSILSPDVPAADKRLEVHLRDQIVIAYEADMPVQMFRCSGGTEFYDHYLTPTGNFTTDYKRPSRHMINGNKATATTYDLPGVPWVTFFTEDGISFHGTYWHNDFGRPRSHGCINLPSEAAKWVYRWTLPHVPYEEQRAYKNGGTRVSVVL